MTVTIPWAYVEATRALAIGMAAGALIGMAVVLVHPAKGERRE